MNASQEELGVVKTILKTSHIINHLFGISMLGIAAWGVNAELTKGELGLLGFITVIVSAGIAVKKANDCRHSKYRLDLASNILRQVETGKSLNAALSELEDEEAKYIRAVIKAVTKD